jgi:hypothetical protein
MNTQPATRPRKTRIGGRSTPPRKTEYIYHWNRIAGALAALVLLIGLVAFGIHLWLSSPSAPPAEVRLDVADAPGPQVETAPKRDSRDFPGPAPAPAEPEVMTPGDAADLAEPVAPEIPASTDSGISPDAAPSAATASPIGWDGPGPAEAGETAKEAPSRVFLSPGTRVNLRVAPRLSSPVLRILDPGTELWLLETADDFYRVRLAEGIIGWVSREFSSLAPYATPAP